MTLEIIQKYQSEILELYFKKGYNKTQIANYLMEKLGLDYNYTQADSLRRAISRFINKYESESSNFFNEEDSTNFENNKRLINKTRANILLIDVETTPIFAAVWSLFKVNISIDQIVSDSHLLSWAAKWLFEPKVFGDVLTPEEAVLGNDSRIVRSLWYVLDQADVVIAHNGKKFDVPVINTAFIKNGLNPPSPYVVIDTREVAKKSFRFSSNKLDFINRILGEETKIDTDFKLWLRCVNGDQEALDYMFEYNKHDVEMLEENYTAVRPWIKNHPNLGFYIESDNLICPTCGGGELEEYGHYSTPVNQYTAYRCPHCGAVARGRYSETSVTKKKTLTISVAR